MKRFIPFILLLVCQHVSFSQVGIGTDSPSPRSILELRSSTQGFLMPRMTSTQRLALEPSLTTEDIGLMVFQTVPYRGIFIFQGPTQGENKWICLPTVPDINTDVNGATLRSDGNAWINTTNLFNQGGFIGINALIPRSDLHIHGLGNTTQLQFTDFFTNTAASDGLILGIDFNTGNARLNQQENKPLTFSTNNTERVRIDAEGDVGIGQNNPQAKLDVNGTFKLGSSGAVLNNILRQPVQLDIPMCDSMTSVAMNFPFPNAMESATVYISPAVAMGNLMIAYSRVSAPGYVEIKFMNMGNTYDPAPMVFYITVIQ